MKPKTIPMIKQKAKIVRPLVFSFQSLCIDSARSKVTAIGIIKSIYFKLNISLKETNKERVTSPIEEFKKEKRKSPPQKNLNTNTLLQIRAIQPHNAEFSPSLRASENSERKDNIKIAYGRVVSISGYPHMKTC